MKKLTTTYEHRVEHEIDDVCAFVFAEPTVCVGPVVWCVSPSQLKKPMAHNTKQDGDCYTHRIVWADCVGVKVTTPKKHIPAATMRLLRDVARETCEMIEARYHGRELH